MKNLILCAISTLLILTGCGNTSNFNYVKSENQEILIPDTWIEDSYDEADYITTLTVNNAYFTVLVVDKLYMSADEYLNILDSIEVERVIDKTIDFSEGDSDRKINYILFKFEIEDENIFSFIATVEFKGDEEKYLLIQGSVESEKDGNNVIKDILNLIKFNDEYYN